MRSLLFPALFMLFFTACIENKVEGPVTGSGSPSFNAPDCILITNANGAPIGTFPDCQPTGQWIATDLSVTELELLNFSDTIAGGFSSTMGISRAFAYPNPVAVNDTLHLGFSGISDANVKIKLAILDEQARIIQQLAIRSDHLDVSDVRIDNSSYDPGAFYRIYYRVSGAAETVFFEGFGDIYICRNGTVDEPEACF
ncbi:MAG: hypothetical protein R2824_33605 [Saprospiraceae bacterium]|nr:hypothetical protein [Lewinella sp.]